MARGNCIVVTADPRGKFEEGYIAAGITPKPGTILQRDASIALKSGRHTYKLYTRGADGKRPAGALWVLRENYLLGTPNDTAYAAGDRCFLYSPVAGEELNMLLGDVAGTADDHALGEILMPDETTGKLVATTGTPEMEGFQLLEAITDPVADTLAWVQYSGY